MIWHKQEIYKVFSVVEQAYRALAPKGGYIWIKNQTENADTYQ